ncbi:MAG: IS110 family transposase [Candidatus Marinimicrobia bacterium]|nr:IS110 family transposase [Candidatus Neomarinimicrobiota bacterium]
MPLTSIPGIGEIYAAGIISEIGDISSFSSNDQIAKLAGLVWPEHQSASFKKFEESLSGEETRFLRSSNKYLSQRDPSEELGLLKLLTP